MVPPHRAPQPPAAAPLPAVIVLSNAQYAELFFSLPPHQQATYPHPGPPATIPAVTSYSLQYPEAVPAMVCTGAAAYSSISNESAVARVMNDPKVAGRILDKIIEPLRPTSPPDGSHHARTSPNTDNSITPDHSIKLDCAVLASPAVDGTRRWLVDVCSTAIKASPALKMSAFELSNALLDIITSAASRTARREQVAALLTTANSRIVTLLEENEVKLIRDIGSKNAAAREFFGNTHKLASLPPNVLHKATKFTLDLGDWHLLARGASHTELDAKFPLPGQQRAVTSSPALLNELLCKIGQDSLREVVIIGSNTSVMSTLLPNKTLSEDLRPVLKRVTRLTVSHAFGDIIQYFRGLLELTTTRHHPTEYFSNWLISDRFRFFTITKFTHTSSLWDAEGLDKVCAVMPNVIHLYAKGQAVSLDEFRRMRMTLRTAPQTARLVSLELPRPPEYRLDAILDREDGKCCEFFARWMMIDMFSKTTFPALQTIWFVGREMRYNHGTEVAVGLWGDVERVLTTVFTPGDGDGTSKSVPDVHPRVSGVWGPYD